MESVVRFWSQRFVLFQSNLQMIVCLKCGVVPHHVYKYPHLSREEAGDLERQAYNRWAVLIGRS